MEWGRGTVENFPRLFSFVSYKIFCMKSKNMRLGSEPISCEIPCTRSSIKRDSMPRLWGWSVGPDEFPFNTYAIICESCCGEAVAGVRRLQPSIILFLLSFIRSHHRELCCLVKETVGAYTTPYIRKIVSIYDSIESGGKNEFTCAMSINNSNRMNLVWKIIVSCSENTALWFILPKLFQFLWEIHQIYSN